MPTYPEFTRLLNEHLTRRDRTPTWLARRLGLHPSTVSRWLNYENRPGDAQTVLRVADALDLKRRGERDALFRACGYHYHAETGGDETAPNTHAPAAVPGQTGGQGIVPDAEPAEAGADAAGREAPFLLPAFPPQGILGREQDLAGVFELLALGDPAARNVPPLALQGMGGIGKTTLAIALGRQEQVAQSFPDGVLWATVGPSPTVRNLLHDWARALGIQLAGERDAAACRDRLRSYLYERRVLLIVDDVWEVGHGEHFMVAGPHCRLLLTTRESPVAHTLATRRRTYRVGVLDEDAALQLLGRLAPEALSADVASARRLCNRLEYLPLALTLAGRMLANEADVLNRMRRLVDELIERRQARLQLLQAEGRVGLDQEEPVSLQAVLGMSIERLSRADRERFAMLAVFGAEPLLWESEAAAHVWQCSHADAESTISHFIQRGLVVPKGDRYWTHALLADYAAEMMDEMGL